MQKFPFTEQGVADMCYALYQLDDVSLGLEAEAIQLSFVDWTLNHLDLDISQEAYLTSLHPTVQYFTGMECSLAMLHRRPIILDKPLSSGLRATKLFKPKSSLALTVAPDMSIIATGDVTIEISYA